MAHELGHNLGMLHDDKAGCSRDGFIMSPTRYHHHQVWSPGIWSCPPTEEALARLSGQSAARKCSVRATATSVCWRRRVKLQMSLDLMRTFCPGRYGVLLLSVRFWLFKTNDLITSTACRCSISLDTPNKSLRYFCSCPLQCLSRISCLLKGYRIIGNKCYPKSCVPESIQICDYILISHTWRFDIKLLWKVPDN